MTITLTPELEKRIRERAEKTGITLESMTLDSLNQMYPPKDALDIAPNETTLAEYWADYIGGVQNDGLPCPASHSEGTGQRFAALMMEKYPRGDK